MPSRIQTTWPGGAGSGASSRSKTKAGWTIGGGVEWMS